MAPQQVGVSNKVGLSFLRWSQLFSRKRLPGALARTLLLHILLDTFAGQFVGYFVETP